MKIYDTKRCRNVWLFSNSLASYFIIFEMTYLAIFEFYFLSFAVAQRSTWPFRLRGSKLDWKNYLKAIKRLIAGQKQT